MGRDYFGKNADALKRKRLFLFDMDGTIYQEERLFEGTLPLMEQIRNTGGRYVFITNNSSRSVADYVAKLNRLGIPADEDDFFTSSQATILYIRKHYPDAKVYCQGTRSLVRELRKGGIQVTEEIEDGIGAIVVGFDTELTSAKLRRTCELLNRDIPFLATNPDLVCPVSFGYVPDCGSMCMMLENATKRKPIYLGKPEPTMIHIVMEKLGMRREDTVVVGDRLYTDIASGLSAGVSTICVLTGEATVEDIQKERDRPTYTFQSVKEIFDSLQDD